MKMRSFFPQPLFDPNPTPVVPAEKPWIDTLDPEVKGYLQMRGLADKPVNDIALAAIKSHQDATKKLSYPQEQILFLPKDPNDAAMKNVWQRLGAPNNPDGYDFASVKHASGKEVSTETLALFRKTAHDHNMPAPMAIEMAKAHVKLLDAASSSALAEYTTKLDASKAALKESWKANFDVNMIVAKTAATKFGVKPEVIAALETNVEYASIMEMFRQIGMKMGEGRVVTSGMGDNAPMTKEEAKAQIDALMGDAEWKNKYLNGIGTARKDHEKLVRVWKGITA